MGLTRPKAVQIDFDVTNITDPLIRINSGESGSADKDAGIVIERGSDANVALIWDESADQFAVINTSETGTTAGNVTVSSYADLKANDIWVNDDLMVGDYQWFNADGGQFYFGVDSDIRLTHDHNRGLILKNRLTTDDTPAILTLQSTESSITVGDKLGVIDFQVPNESSGTDAIEISAGIEAVAEGTFAADNNATKLSFKTAASETATEKASLSSAGLFTATSIDATVLTGDLPAIDGSNLTGVSGSSYTHPNHSGDIVSAGDGATTIQAGAVDIAMLSASGTASSSTFLRGDNSWVTPTDTDTNTTYSSSDFSLSGLSGTTVTTSDPTNTSNPSAVGHLWLNSSSGESFVCTNATTDDNAWYNIGEGSGGVEQQGWGGSASGGAEATYGDYTIHTFLSSGTFAVTTGGEIDYLVVAGGGGGGSHIGGGGGAGGMLTATTYTIASGNHSITIGGGGAGSTNTNGTAGDGSNTVFGSIATATGGGGGGSGYGDGRNGGSGGGVGHGTGAGGGTVGQGTAGQGNNGGNGNQTGSHSSGGGGGKAAVGGTGAQGGTAGGGGGGEQWNLDGLGYYYAGGGGGGGMTANAGNGGQGGGGGGDSESATDGTGGTSGRNAGGTGGDPAGSGGANTGGGGGGGGHSSRDGGAGGSGIVIIRYLT